MAGMLTTFLNINWDDISRYHQKIWYVNVQMEPEERSLWLDMMQGDPARRLTAREAYERWNRLRESRFSSVSF
jgi:hypothetical protein